MRNAFTIRNRATQIWLLFNCAFAAAVTYWLPPAFWLGAVGAPFILLSYVLHGARTGQWQRSENESESPLSRFEGWAAASGVILGIPRNRARSGRTRTDEDDW